MKLKAGEIPGFLKAPPAGIAVVLVYGPDRGLVRERADALGLTAVEALDDPFTVSTLTGADLADDPARLADEAGAIGLMGGRRLVRVREAGDPVAALLSAYLAAPIPEALVVVEAGDLPARSKLRKAAEGHAAAAALPCYLDDGMALSSVISEVLRINHLRADPETMSYLENRLGGDRALTRRELEKLALYVGPGDPASGDPPRPVTLADAEACVGDAAALTLDTVVEAAALGDRAGLDRAMDRALGAGVAPFAVHRAVLNHFKRLHRAAMAMDEGLSPDQAMKALAPPVFFKAQGAFRQALRLWTGDRLARAIVLLVEAEIAMKSTGMPGPTLLRRELMRLASAAGR